ncbi:MAG: DUF3846 domain-containing protein [Clostridia bacterium]|nr:DUF3846 domain-containing protein [Clostridia bacterium]
MKTEKITVVIVPPFTEPYKRIIRLKLENLRHIVEGGIETTYDDGLPDMIIVCNNENKLNGLKFNRIIKQGEDTDYIFGTFFVCGMGTDDFCSLTDEQAERAIKRFSRQKKA